MESISQFSAMSDIPIPIILLIGFVALLYSSVGHGGASGYLAVLSLLGFAPALMSSTALTLNIIVASVSAFMYIRAGHFSWPLCWPFLITSIPAAFLGGLWHVEKSLYFLILAFTLLFVAIRLLVQLNKKSADEGEPTYNKFSLSLGLLYGALIGFLSGVVGIGGGIFLTPLILLMRWSDAKSAAAVSAVFIVLNSIAGLLSRYLASSLELSCCSALVISALIGGLIGAKLGANIFSQVTLRCVLAFVLIIAAFKLVLNSSLLHLRF